MQGSVAIITDTVRGIDDDDAFEVLSEKFPCEFSIDFNYPSQAFTLDWWRDAITWEAPKRIATKKHWWSRHTVYSGGFCGYVTFALFDDQDRPIVRGDSKYLLPGDTITVMGSVKK
jgi:hypothetical protein